jgi:hypothetical protein
VFVGSEPARILGPSYSVGTQGLGELTCLLAPRRAGINYMLSTENRVPVDDEGTIRPYRPHVMIYAPYLRNADFGATRDGRSPVFVINEGQPGAYLIVPVPGPADHAHPQPK